MIRCILGLLVLLTAAHAQDVDTLLKSARGGDEKATAELVRLALRGKLDATSALVVLGEPAARHLVAELGREGADSDLAVLLTKVAPDNEAAIGPLIESKDLRSLARMGPAAKRALPDIEKWLAGSIFEKRVRLLGAHWRIAGDSKVIAELSGLYRAGNKHMQKWTMEALGRIGPAARSVVPTLLARVPGAEFNDEVWDTLISIGNGPESIPIAERWLDAEETRLQGTWLLGRIEPPDKRAARRLVLLANDPSLEIRKQAVISLCNVGPVTREVVPTLMREFERATAPGAVGDELEMVSSVAYHLGQMGPPARLAAPVFRKTLKNPRARYQHWAAHGLGCVGDAARLAVPDLIRALDDLDPAVRSSAAGALGKLGPIASRAASALRKRMRAKPSNFTVICALALWQVESGDAEAVAHLIRALDREEAHWWVLRMLAKVGRDGIGARPKLEKLLRHEYVETRVAAAIALWRCCGERDAALDHLMRGLANELELEFDMAVPLRALGEMGTEARAALPLVERVLRELDVDVLHCKVARETAAKIRGER